MTEESDTQDTDAIAGGSNDDGVDVLWEGSPLHEHLIKQKEEMLLESTTCINDDISPYMNISEEVEDRHAKLKSPLRQSNETNGHVVPNGDIKSNPTNQSSILSSAKSFAWPESRRIEVLQVEVARQLLESDLLVQEDEDFINNFLLTDAALEDYHRYTAKGGTSSILGDMLLFSGSVAAVAGAVFFLSERTRAVGAAAAAALLPTALAFGTASTTRMSTKISEEQEKSNFDNLIKRLLGDMQLFKKLVRKCLNLLQGMELIHAGHLFAINSVTGGPMASVPMSTNQEKEQSCLSQALANRAAFPALRRAAYQCTVQLIMSYRSAVEKLMEVSPLADHVDLKDHYIAFIELESFGIEEDLQMTMESIKGEEISVKMMKDTVQVALVQQSEYLRRFGLVFCDSVREDCDGVDHPLNKAGVLKHIRDMIETLSKINGKLSRVFDYHEAMGIDLTKEKEHKALVNSKKNYNQLDFVPIRSVYTSLFSTGLHLQNSLLKVRQLENIFDLIEKRKYEDHNDKYSCEENTTPVSIKGRPSQTEIIQWLKGFEEIQGELNACVGCLEDGVSNIDKLQDTKKGNSKDHQNLTDVKTEDKESDRNQSSLHVLHIVDDNDPRQHLDEVFEAVNEKEATDDEWVHNEGRERKIYDGDFQSKIKSEQRLMQELKTVLAGKHAEHEKREAMAIARQGGQTEIQKDIIHLHNNNKIQAQGSSKRTINGVNSLKNSTYSTIPATEGQQSPELEEKDNEYCELMINYNQQLLDSPTATNLKSYTPKKSDPFSCNNASMVNDDKRSSEWKIQGFEDSFVPPIDKEDKLNNLENNGCINNELALEAYLQDSLKAAKIKATSPLEFTPSYTNEETKMEQALTNGFISKNTGDNSNQSKRKYIKHIFEKTASTKEPPSINSDNRSDVSNELEKSNHNICNERRSRDLPPLKIEKNYSADESESASDSVSSDQGTVKLKGPLNDGISQSPAPDEDLSNDLSDSNNIIIPRSISGQVLTDEDEHSFFEKTEEKDDVPSSPDEIANQIDSDESVSSSSESADGSIESSSENATKTENAEKYKEPSNGKLFSSNNTRNQVFSETDSTIVNSFESPFESSMTTSISSSEASSFVYNENPVNTNSNDQKVQLSCSALPLSMTSSFYSSFCQTNKSDIVEQINCSLSDIRSVSTPDLKRLAIISSISSPYISLEEIEAKDNDVYNNSSDDQSSSYSDTLNDSYLTSFVADDLVDEGSVHSSTEWGSADELDHHVLKTYRRPLRPAANITPTEQQDDRELENKCHDESIQKNPIICSNSSSSKEKRRAKRSRNQSIIFSDSNSQIDEYNKNSCDTSKKEQYHSMQHTPTSNIKAKNSADKEDKKVDKNIYSSILNSATQSVYLSRKKKENGGKPLQISLPRNPLGFDSLLATEVAKKARNFTTGLSSKNKSEQVFGDIDSD